MADASDGRWRGIECGDGRQPDVNPGYELVVNRDYPEIADDYRKTFRLLKALPCDIFLGAMAVITGWRENTRGS